MGGSPLAFNCGGPHWGISPPSARNSVGSCAQARKTGAQTDGTRLGTGHSGREPEGEGARYFGAGELVCALKVALFGSWRSQCYFYAKLALGPRADVVGVSERAPIRCDEMFV